MPPPDLASLLLKTNSESARLCHRLSSQRPSAGGTQSSEEGGCEQSWGEAGAGADSRGRSLGSDGGWGPS